MQADSSHQSQPDRDRLQEFKSSRSTGALCSLPHAGFPGPSFEDSECSEREKS